MADASSSGARSGDASASATPLGDRRASAQPDGEADVAAAAFEGGGASLLPHRDASGDTATVRDATGSGHGARPAKMATLEKYFGKQPKPVTNPVRKRSGKRRHWLVEYETEGRIPSSRVKHFTNNLIDQLMPVWLNVDRPQVVEQSPWAPPPTARRSYISSVEFNAQGDKLLCGHAGGQLAVLDSASLSDLPHACAIAKGAPGGMRRPNNSFNPVEFQTATQHSVDKACWSPVQSSKVLCVGHDLDGVHLVDLEASTSDRAQGRIFRTGKPALTLSRQRTRFTDCCYCLPASPVSVVASSGESIYAWDARAKPGKPVMQLRGPACRSASYSPLSPPGPSSTRIRCVEQSCDGLLLHGGTDTGMIHTWDLRQPSGSAPGRGPMSLDHAPAATGGFRFGNEAPGTLPIDSFSIAYRLQKASPFQGGRLAQAREVQSLTLHRSSGAELAFNMEGGVCGIVDLLSGSLSQVHVPGWLEPERPVLAGDSRVLSFEPRPEPVQSTEKPVLHWEVPRSCWWRQQQQSFLVSPSGSSSLKFLELPRDSRSCRTSMDDWSQVEPKSLHLELSPVCVAAHPWKHLMVVGGNLPWLGVLHPTHAEIDTVSNQGE